ncbi:hypothetical protein B0H17DRAFT_1090381 [Mycena rosella]|uniref:Uncharacterized protein n=1 Tax=Mycena rosella TaxID=1033263 RepID=A0AAD7CVY8_MYCRO|nr:hypothetical protein B0H17DRAFT_1090381 [Mycena rosella]
MWSLVPSWNPRRIQACARALCALLLGAWLTALVSEYEPALLLLPFVIVVMGLYEVVVRARPYLPALLYALHRAQDLAPLLLLFKWYNRAAKARLVRRVKELEQRLEGVGEG